MAHARYQQIADRLRDQIAREVYGPGERLPSEPDLMDEYQASRNTVRLAIALLTNQGLVVTRQGLGTFVQQPTRPFTALLSRVNVSPDAYHADTAMLQTSSRSYQGTAGWMPWTRLRIASSAGRV